LVRIDPHGPGITRVRDTDGVRYLDPAGAEITDAATLDRIRALRVPPAWAEVWISPDPVGHIQATGTDSKGRLQYLYHQLWREQRDAQKFGHMLRFADALPRLRTATTADLRHRGLTRDRVVASVVRLIDLGMFRIGGERYAELDHHYGAITLQKQHVRVTRDGILFDYTAKWGKQRTIVIKDSLVQPTVRALARVDNDLDPLWCYEQDGRWHILHSRDVGNYIAARAGGHFTAKEFRTWNATVLMALALANAGPSSTAADRKRTIAASVREVANWLGLPGALFARVRVQTLEFVRVDGPHHPRRERLLEEAADPPGAVPGRGDLYERGAVSRGDRGRRDQAGAGIGLGQDPARFGFVHPHPVLAGTSARGHREPRDRAGPDAPGFHSETRERRRQVTRVVIAHVRDIPVDLIGRCIDRTLSGDHDFRHAGLSITAGQVRDVSAEAPSPRSGWEPFLCIPYDQFLRRPIGAPGGEYAR